MSPSRMILRCLLLLLLAVMPAAFAAEDPAVFKKRLTGHSWQWRAAEGGAAWDKIEFREGGAFAASKAGKSSFESTWRAPEAGKVEVMNKDAVGMMLAFDGYGLSFTAQNAAGKRAGVGRILDWQGLNVEAPTQVAQDKGGKSATMADLEFILKDYGQPKLSLEPREKTHAYRGPRLIGEVTKEDVKIPYLAPREEAEKILFERTPMSSKQDALAPGFPGGLSLRTYDIRFNGFNRVTFVMDRAEKVICVQLKAENTLHSAEGQKGWKKLERDFHTFDFVRMEERARATAIECFVYDNRNADGFIVVQTLVPANKETTRCYLPVPLIELILNNLSEAGVRIK